MSRLSYLGNSLRSALLMISSMSKSVCETPRRKAFRDMVPIPCLSSFVSGKFDMIRPVNNVCSA